jgi:hypothetical protein
VNDATVNTLTLIAAGHEETKDQDHKDAAKGEATTYKHQSSGDVHYRPTPMPRHMIT